MSTRRKRPRDMNQLAKLVVEIGTGQVEDREPTPEDTSRWRQRSSSYASNAPPPLSWRPLSAAWASSFARQAGRWTVEVMARLGFRVFLSSSTRVTTLRVAAQRPVPP
jgi:hypothetical protein